MMDPAPRHAAGASPIPVGGWPGRGWRCRLRRAVALLAGVAGLLTGAHAADAAAPAAPDEVYRVVVSGGAFTSMNINDATAAMKSWAAAVAAERKLELQVEVTIYTAEPELRKTVAEGSYNALSLTSEEFFHFGGSPARVALAVRGEDWSERYVVLVRADAGIDGLAALRGRRLVRHVSHTTTPALPWLETAFAARGLGRVKAVLGELRGLESPSKAILQVFFHQADACLVSARTFAVAGELNPQLRQQLKELESSPPLVPSVLVFRSEPGARSKFDFETAVAEVHNSVAGRQVLTVFQSTRMEIRPLSDLESTRAMFEHYDRLTGGDTRAVMPPSPPLLPPSR